jgi:ribonuclease HI
VSEHLTIYTDGCSKGNPGPASIGVAAYRNDERLPSFTISDAVGTLTNNQAEYRALIRALEYAVGGQAADVEVRSDSQLIVRQMNGSYRVKDVDLKPLYQEAQRLAGKIAKFSINYVPREYNRQADKLANLALH